MAHKITILMASGLFCLAATIAAADTIDDVNFTYTDSANGNLTASGDLIVDATTGFVLSGSGKVNSSLFVNAGSPPTPIGTQSITLFNANNYTSMTNNAVNVGGGVYQIADSDGTNLTFDNKFNSTTSPFVADDNGLLFAVGGANARGNYSSFNIYLYSAGVLHDFLGAGGQPQSQGGTQVYSDAGPGIFTINSITPVPLPIAAWLMLSGLGGLGTFARKRRL